MSRDRKKREATLSPHDQNEVALFKEYLQRGADGHSQEKAYALVYGGIGAPRVGLDACDDRPKPSGPPPVTAFEIAQDDIRTGRRVVYVAEGGALRICAPDAIPRGARALSAELGLAANQRAFDESNRERESTCRTRL